MVDTRFAGTTNGLQEIAREHRLGPAGAEDIAGPWSVRIYLKPFIDWIWMGAFLMALGGFLAVSDRRYRLAVKRKATSLAGGAGASAAAD